MNRSTNPMSLFLNYVTKWNVLFLLSFSLWGCDSGDSVESTSLQGRWLNCFYSETGAGVELVFHGASWAVHANDYADSNCENLSRSEVVEQGQFVTLDNVNTDSGIVATTIDISANFGTIDNYRKYFDLFYIEANKLYFGLKFHSDINTLESRPSDIDYSYSFTRG